MKLYLQGGNYQGLGGSTPSSLCQPPTNIFPILLTGVNRNPPVRKYYHSVLKFLLFYSFYPAMLCIRGTSHGPVSVCVCLTQVGVLLKRLNVGSQKQHHTIAHGL